jgi:glycosyltransferase involved in cell wall biosynthesis
MVDKIIEKTLTTHDSIAVIIPTYNGAHKVLNVLKALEKQTYKEFITILVIDGSTDRTEKLIQRFKPNLQLAIIKQENKGRAGARNAGAAASNADLLIFIDDDIRPTPNCIELHLEHHVAYPNTALSGSANEDSKKAKTDFQLYKAARGELWMSTFSEDFTKLKNENLFFTSANCSIPRHIFNKFDGFDMTLNDCEDFDLSARMMIGGIDLYLNKKCLGWHDDFITIRKYIKRQREYRKSWHNLLNLKPELLIHFNRFNPSSPSCYAKLFFKLFAHKYWIYLIDKTKILQVLPKTFRYRIYDYVIASLGRFNTHVSI